MGKLIKKFHWHSEKERQRVLFIEWVYYKFFSDEVDGIVVYGCADGLPGVMFVQVFPKKNGFHVEEPIQVVRHDYPSGLVTRSSEDYSCQIDCNSVKNNGLQFNILGSVEKNINQVEWDLSFNSKFPPMFAFEENFGVFDIGSIGWKVISPLSNVSGQISANGKSYKIKNGRGYIDTNYGRWLFSLDRTTNWNWILGHERGEDPRYSLVGLNIRDRGHLGKLFFCCPEFSIDFSTSSSSFSHLNFAEDPKTGVIYPDRTHALFENRCGYRLEILAENEAAFVHAQKIPPKALRGPLPELGTWALVENFVKITGALETPSGRRLPIDATGIKEYPVSCFLPSALRKRLNRSRGARRAAS